MLRESATLTGQTIDLEGLTDPNCHRIDGIPHSEALLRFADTFMADEADAYRRARAQLADEMGDAAMVDAVGVASNFQRMDRIADATGIPSDEALMVMSEELREQLKLNDFASASNTPKVPWLKRMFLKLFVIGKFRDMIRSASPKATD
jgi:hypothetical protein